jgi:lipoyl(octanoyl) transferase
MRVDVDLLDTVARGAPPALRLYTWAAPALSLGRFQDDAAVDDRACLRLGVDVVRRPSGGRALLHGGDLTYAVAMARPPGANGRVDTVYARLADGLIAGLDRLGVRAAVARNRGELGPVCFSSQRGADLRVGDRKVCGSAQVQRDGVVLQHGALLLRRLSVDETDLLTGGPSRDELHTATVTLDELGAPHDPRTVADALVDGFSDALGITFAARHTRRPVATKGR